MDFAFITIILQLIFLECILSIDNAAVLGAMVAPLPNDRPVPWPRTMHGVLSRLDPLLGPQRQAALKVGLLGAYAGAVAAYRCLSPLSFSPTNILKGFASTNATLAANCTIPGNSLAAPVFTAPGEACINEVPGCFLAMDSR